MTDQHPIAPPPELVKEWIREANHNEPMFEQVAKLAAAWGSDMELEACCEWLQDPDLNVDTYKLRAARRPKPPSLKEEALALLRVVEVSDDAAISWDFDVIRRALESLPN